MILNLLDKFFGLDLKLRLAAIAGVILLLFVLFDGCKQKRIDKKVEKVKEAVVEINETKDTAQDSLQAIIYDLQGEVRQLKVSNRELQADIRFKDDDIRAVLQQRKKDSIKIANENLDHLSADELRARYQRAILNEGR